MTAAKRSAKNMNITGHRKQPSVSQLWHAKKSSMLNGHECRVNTFTFSYRTNLCNLNVKILKWMKNIIHTFTPYVSPGSLSFVCKVTPGLTDYRHFKIQLLNNNVYEY